MHASILMQIAIVMKVNAISIAIAIAISDEC